VHCWRGYGSPEGGKADALVSWKGTRSMQVDEGVVRTYLAFLLVVIGEYTHWLYDSIELIDESIVEEFEGLVNVRTRQMFGFDFHSFPFPLAGLHI
jgi:hypothetical protein